MGQSSDRGNQDLVDGLQGVGGEPSLERQMGQLIRKQNQRPPEYSTAPRSSAPSPPYTLKRAIKETASLGGFLGFAYALLAVPSATFGTMLGYAFAGAAVGAIAGLPLFLLGLVLGVVAKIIAGLLRIALILAVIAGLIYILPALAG